MMTSLLAIAMAMVAWKFRKWHDQSETETTKLKRRVEELERALVRDECQRGEFNFTTRRTIDMES